MGNGPSSPGTLGRRELIRRGALAAAAAAVIAPGRMAAAGGLRFLAGDEDAGLRALRTDGLINGLTAHGDQLVAVGAIGAAPAVWAYDGAARAWRRTAGASAFPTGVSLAAVTSMGGLLVATGAIERRVASTRAHVTVADFEPPRPRPAGAPALPVPHHPPVEEVEIEHHVLAPAVFASADGIRWETVLDGVAGVAGGSLSAVAALGAGSVATQVVAVGTEYTEADVPDAAGLLALVSLDGRSWTRTRLEGVSPPQHGEVTMLAAVGDDLLLGSNGFGTTNLYRAARAAAAVSSAAAGLDASAPLGPWNPVAGPVVEGPLTFVAAGATAAGTLLAAVDHLDAPRFWMGEGPGWREVGAPAAMAPPSRLSVLGRYDGALVGGGTDGSQARVERIGG